MISAICVAQPAGATGVSYADPLTRAQAGAVDGQAIDRTTWSADKSVQYASDTTGGVTVSTPAGGTFSHAVSRMSGTYALKAELKPANGGSMSIGLGNETMQGNFYGSCAVSVGVARGGLYEIRAGRGAPLRAGSAKDFGGLRDDGFVAIKLTYDSAAALLDVEINGKTVVAQSDVSTRLSAPRIARAGAHISGPVVANEPRVRQYSLSMIPSATSGLSLRDSTECFITPDQPSRLTLTAETVVGDKLTYDLLDFEGRVVRQGEATVASDGLVTAELSLPSGYYEVRFKPTGETFGVMSIAPSESPDPYFAMDAGLTWLEPRDPVRAQMIRILQRSGIKVVRERLSWGSLHAGKNELPTLWEGGQRNDSVRALYTRHGIKLLEIIYGGGQRFAYDARVEYPQKLGLAAKSWRAVTDRFSGNWAGIEVWNEPDVIVVPADQYAPVVKMTAYVNEQARSNVPVVAGAFTGNTPGAYHEVCAANDVIAHADAISFHSYSSPSELCGLIGEYRKWLAKSGRESLPLWLTEGGKAWPLRDRPTVPDAAASATAIVAQACEGKAAGLAHYFPFILVSWHIDRKDDHGLMAPDLSPLRGMAGYVYAARALAGLDYAGDLPATPEAHSVRVYGDRDEQVIVVYLRKTDPEAKIDLGVPVTRVTGIDGRALAHAGSVVPVPDGVGFAFAKKTDLAPHLITDTPAATLNKLARAPVAPRTPAAPVVLTHVINREAVKLSSRRYLITEAVAKALPIRVRASSMSSEAQSISVSLTLPGGAPVEPKRVQVPPLGEVELDWSIDASQAIDVAETRFIRITGQIEGGLPLSTLAIPLVAEGSLETHLARHTYRRALPIGDLSLWKPNITGHGKMSMSAADGNGWKLDTTFSHPMERWVYPVFKVTEPIDASRARGVLIRARISERARNVAIMLRGNDKPGFWANEFMPADGQWHVAYIPFDTLVPETGNPLKQDAIFKPELVKTLMVGMGSDSPQNGMEVSHLLIVGQERE